MAYLFLVRLMVRAVLVIIAVTFAVSTCVVGAADHTSPCWPKDVPAITPENIRSGKIKAVAIFAPKPDYPNYARDRHWVGTGCFVMHVDPKTGLVKYVEILQSTGHKMLDDEVVAAFGRWRFKPGVVAPKVASPVTFSLTKR